jgi:3-isopropylmalate/(R)-2-methylmalate dehydratase large subunit
MKSPRRRPSWTWSRGKDRVFDPTRIKAVIDHVTPAKDSKTAARARSCGTGPGATASPISSISVRNGVCHALFPEKGFIRPGYTVIMGDSHTCTHGAFGAFAAGVGTTDLEVGILKGVCAFKTRKPFASTSPAACPTEFMPRMSSCRSSADRCQRRHQQGDRICRPGGGGHVHGIAHDPVQHGHRSRRHLRHLRTGPNHRGYLWPFIKNDYDTPEAALAAFAAYWPDADARYAQVIDHDVSHLEPLVTFGYKPDKVKPVPTWPVRRWIRSTSAPAPTAASRTCASPPECLESGSAARCAPSSRRPRPEVYRQALAEEG